MGNICEIWTCALATDFRSKRVRSDELGKWKSEGNEQEKVESKIGGRKNNSERLTDDKMLTERNVVD